MSLTSHYIDKIIDIQHQLLPVLQILDNDNEKKFKKYILNKNMDSLSNIIHNIDNIMLEIIKLKFDCQSFCSINNRNDLLSKINLDDTLLKNENIKEKIHNDKENQDIINKFIPIMMYYSMMKDLNNDKSHINFNNGNDIGNNNSIINEFGPSRKVDLNQEIE